MCMLILSVTLCSSLFLICHRMSARHWSHRISLRSQCIYVCEGEMLAFTMYDFLLCLYNCKRLCASGLTCKFACVYGMLLFSVCAFMIFNVNEFVCISPSSPAHLPWPRWFPPWSGPPCCLWTNRDDRRKEKRRRKKGGG